MTLRIQRSLTATAIAAALTLGLAGCSFGGTPTASIGDTKSIEIASGADSFPVDVTVISLEQAPDEVQESFEDDSDVWFAEVEFTYTGDSSVDPARLGVLFSGVYSELKSGAFLDSTFIGLPECPGSPEGSATEAYEALAAGETVGLCVPLSSDGDDAVTGVYVGSTDLESGGAVWRP